MAGPETIVARNEELAAVAGFLDAVETGPATLVLEGDAGFGKTRLWREAVAAADARGFQVLACRCAESERELSFTGLGDLLRPVVAEVLPSLSTPLRRALEAALLLADTEGPAPDRRAVSLAVLAVLQELGSTDPVLVAVDDLQWLDPPSARVLEFALRRLSEERVGLVATLRTGLERPELSLDDVERVAVGALPAAALGELVQARLVRPLPRTALGELHRASGGNPLYALEIARGLDPHDLDAAAPLPLPRSLRALVAARIAELPAATRASLLIAAALAQPTRAAIEAAGGTDVRAAFEAGLVELEGERVRFTHPLLASAVYADADLEERRALHRRLASLVPDPEERARHLVLASTGPDETVAAALEAAGDHARARGAPDASAELYEQALRLTPPDALDDQARRALAANRDFVLVGRFDRARAIGEEMTAKLPPGPDRARLGWYRGPRRAGTSDEQLTPLDPMLAEAGDDLVARAQIAEELAFRKLVIDGDLAGALDLGTKAKADAAASGDEARALSALSAVAWFEAMSGKGVSQELAAAVARPEYTSEPYQIYESPSYRLGVVRLWADDVEGARPLLEAENRRALEWGENTMRAAVLSQLAELEWRAGEWPRARAHAQEAVALAGGGEFRQLEGVTLGALALVAGQLGQVEEAREAAGRAIAISEEISDCFFAPHYRSALTLLELSRGDAAAAEAAAAPAVQLLREVGVEEPGLYPLWGPAIEALIELGETASAEALVERLEEQGRRLGRVSALSTAARCRGLLATAAGEREEAERAFAEALELHERLPYPFELARTLLAAGTAARRFHRQRAAREHLERALELFESLGAALWAERTRAEIGSVGGRRASAGKLSPTEERVAQLVAQGKSNREVADALYMSPKTVEWNLSKVYRKLHVHSRTELAAKLGAR